MYFFGGITYIDSEKSIRCCSNSKQQPVFRQALQTHLPERAEGTQNGGRVEEFDRCCRRYSECKLLF